MKFFRYWFILIIPLLISACATSPDIKDMVVQAETIEGHLYSQNLRDNVIVTNVAGGEETNPLWTSEINAEDFKGALMESLKLAGLLNTDESLAGYQLIAVILNADQPLFGFDMTVSVEVEYTLLNAEKGEEAYHEALTSEYTATVSDAFYGVERLKIANEGAVRANITMLLENLTKLDIGH